MDIAPLIGVATGAAALLGAAVALYKSRAEKVKTEAETEGTVVSTAVEMAERLTGVAGSLLKPLQDQVQTMQADLASARERIAKLERAEQDTKRELAKCEEREASLRETVAQFGGQVQSALANRRASDRLDQVGESLRQQGLDPGEEGPPA